jgi:type I restriction enzyme S subunit
MQAGKNISAAKIFPTMTKEHPYRCIGGNGLRGYTDTFNTSGNHSIVGRQGALCGCLNIENGDFYATEHAVVVDTYDIISASVMYYFLTALNLNQYATATAQPGLAVSNIIEVYFPLPPIKEQQRIINKIKSLDPLISQFGEQEKSLNSFNEQVYSQLKKSVLQEAIQGKLVPQIASEGTAQELLEQIQQEKLRLVKEGVLKKSTLASSVIFKGDDNKYYEKVGSDINCIDDEIPFDIPSSWAWIRLGYIVDFSKSSSVKTESLSPNTWVLDLEDIEKDSGKILNKKRMATTIAKSDKHPFQKGNVLYSKLRPYLNKVVIADEDGVCTSEILVFDFRNIDNKYAQYYLMSQYFVDYAMRDAYGVKMPRLGSKQGNAALMPLPPIAEQHRIVSKIENLSNLLK